MHKTKGKKYEERFLTEKDPQTGQDKIMTRFSRKMCNYFSFGIDAMTGYGNKSFDNE